MDKWKPTYEIIISDKNWFFFWTIFLWNRSLCFIRGCHKGFWTMESSHFIFWGIVCQKTHAGFGNVNCFWGCQVLHSFDFWLESFDQILFKCARLSQNVINSIQWDPNHWSKAHTQSHILGPFWIIIVGSVSHWFVWEYVENKHRQHYNRSKVFPAEKQE